LVDLVDNLEELADRCWLYYWIYDFLFSKIYL